MIKKRLIKECAKECTDIKNCLSLNPKEILLAAVELNEECVKLNNALLQAKQKINEFKEEKENLQQELGNIIRRQEDEKIIKLNIRKKSRKSWKIKLINFLNFP